MRLQDIKATTANFYLKHPVTDEPIKTDEGVEVYWEVVGKDSKEFAQAQQEFLQHLQTIGKDDKENNKIDYTQWATHNLAVLVKGWDKQFNDFMGGEHSAELVTTLLSSEDQSWIADQLDAFVTKRQNFFRV